MDDVLQRMLAIEKEAGQLVEEAEIEAQRILEQGRLEADQLHAELQEQLALQIEQIRNSRIAEAIKKKENVLASAEILLRKRQQQLFKEIEQNIPKAVEQLAYP